MVVFTLIGTLFITGCYKFSGDYTISSYIAISDINLTTYYPEEGTNSEDIDNIWVYVNDDLLGIYEFGESDTIPLIFPVLASGKHKLEIRPGIKLNGISSTRVPYPFYKPIIFEEFDFFPDSIHQLGVLTTSYYPDTKFAWLEDFEQEYISIQNHADTVIERTSPENNPIAFLSLNSKYSGEVNLTTEREVYTGTSYNSFDVEKPGTIIILEMNFKTENFFQVGLVINNGGGSFDEKDLLILNHTTEWKKIYINLGSNLSLSPQAIDYKVIFRSGLEPDKASTKILLDNIKIVYR